MPGGHGAQVLASLFSPGGFVKSDHWVPPLNFQWEGSGLRPRVCISNSSSGDGQGAGLVTTL